MFFISKLCRLKSIFPACVGLFLEFDDIASYVGYCYTWYSWLILRTLLWPICKSVFCFILLPERLLVLSFLIVVATWEFCIYVLINRIVFFYFAVPVKLHELRTGTGEYADWYELAELKKEWKEIGEEIKYFFKNWRSIKATIYARARERNLRRKAVFLRYTSRFPLFRNVRLRRCWFFLAGRVNRVVLRGISCLK